MKVQEKTEERKSPDARNSTLLFMEVTSLGASSRDIPPQGAVAATLSMKVAYTV
jgi:hypothetical protein